MNNKGLIALSGGVAILVVVLVVFFTMKISYSNSEINLRNLITAKQKDNTSQLDNATKQISQVAQVSDEQMSALKDIIVGNSQSRGAGGGTLFKSVQEAVPNVDVQTFRNLQNIIVSARNTWTENQRQLLDLNREHDNCIDLFPSSFFVGNRGKIDVVIVTSSRTKQSFATGEDNDVEVFRKK